MPAPLDARSNMSRRRRSTPIVLVVVAILLTLLHVPAADATASRGPQVRSFSRVDGPLTPHVLTIKGSGFSKVRTVTFGGRKATKVKVVSSKVLRVTTPRMSTAATVVVQVRTASGRSASTSRSRYRFVGAPVVSSLSRSSGPLTGGTVVEVRGRDLDRKPRVTLGGQSVSTVKVVSSKVLRVTTPASYAQDAPVVVTTSYGSSRPSAKARFSYLEPEPVATGSFEATAGTTTLDPSLVASISTQRDATGVVTSWTASLTPAAPALASGATVLLEPGAQVHPAGLAGRVSGTQASGSGPKITVLPLPLEEVLDAVSVRFAGPVGDLTGDTMQSRWSRTSGRAQRGTPSKVGFGDIKAGAFECENSFGEPVEISGKATLEFTNLNPYFQLDRGGLFRDPYVAAWLSYERTASIDISGSEKAECKLRTSWQNSHKKVFVGAYGASFSFGPALEFSIGAKGTVKISQHSYHMTGFLSNPDGSIRRLKAQSADPVSFGVSGSITAEAYAGVEVQIGWLDRLGVGISGGASATASVEASSDDDSAEVCGSLALSLKATLYAYLDVWVKKWKLEGFEASVPLKKLERCWPLVPFSGTPEISTTDFPVVGVGSRVTQFLDTDDSRDGTWRVEPVAPSTRALPPGLILDDDLITGIVTAPGAYPFWLVFEDTYGHTVRASASITVRTVAQLESAAIDQLDAVRDDWGCDSLYLDPTLQQTARDHSGDMAANDYFTLDDLDGNDPGDRMYDAGYDWDSWGESIGRNYLNADRLVDGWMDYDKTFDNITNCDLVDAGLALSYSDDGTSYWTFDQATPAYFRTTPRPTPSARDLPRAGRTPTATSSADLAGGSATARR